jgi:hypothetical protein
LPPLLTATAICNVSEMRISDTRLPIEQSYGSLEHNHPSLRTEAIGVQCHWIVWSVASCHGTEAMRASNAALRRVPRTKGLLYCIQGRLGGVRYSATCTPRPEVSVESTKKLGTRLTVLNITCPHNQRADLFGVYQRPRFDFFPQPSCLNR